MEIELGHIEPRYARLRIAAPERDAMLCASIAEHGQRTPVSVVAAVDAAAGTFVLIDGYARVRALTTLRKDTAIALTLELSEADALIYTHVTERGPRRSALEEGWLLAELCGVYGFSLDRIAHEFGRTRSWVSRRIGLVSALPREVQERVRIGQICAQAAMKFLVPLARANARDCTRLCERLGNERLSVREFEQLYVGYKRAAGDERDRLVEHPLVYLKAVAHLLSPKKKLDRDEPIERRIGRQLEDVAGACWRARKSLYDLSLVDAAVLDKALVRKAYKQTCDAWQALEVMAQEQLAKGA